MQNNLLLAAGGNFFDVAAVVFIVVVSIIRFLYGIMKKPDVPAGAPPQQAAPKTPEALQQEIEKFIRQAQGREPKPAQLCKNRSSSNSVRLNQSGNACRPKIGTIPNRGNSSGRNRKSRVPKRAPELAPTLLSKRHVIDSEVQQSLGENRPRRGEKPNAAAIEQHMQSAFAHKVGSLDTEVDNRSFSSEITTAGKKKERFKITKDQIRQAIIMNEVLMRPKFDE